MKVVYAKTIGQQIQEAKRNAMRDHRDIERVVVTAQEAEQLKREFVLGCIGGIDLYGLGFGRLPKNCTFYGVLIESEVK